MILGAMIPPYEGVRLQFMTIQGGLAMERFSERDCRILFRIVNNDVCMQYPHITSKLKSRYSSLGIANGANQ
jgi:hypothetical protein